MCGFVAIADEQRSALELENLAAEMLRCTAHRGPDYSGTLFEPPIYLGHNRLSILDLSEASNQPMQKFGLHLVFNGEIYNYLELRKELQGAGYSFTTSGDSEVVCAAYAHWGAQCVERFIGMWAIVLWNPVTKTLFCSRDRFGIKPFFYANKNGALHAASEIKAVRKSPLCSNALNEDQIIRGLYLGWMQHWEETYFSDVHILPAAHNLEWCGGNIRVWRYADVNINSIQQQPFEQSAQKFRELFIDAINITSRRDVPMGVCLSGGLDSTSIASVLASAGHEQEVLTFTAYYTGQGEVDERPYINHVLKRYPTIKPFYIQPTDTDVAAAFDRIVGLMDAPMPSSSYISQYFVMGLAAQHGVKVVLDGQGSDEMMGGYMHSMYRSIADCIASGSFAAAFSEWQRHGNRQGYTTTKKLNVIAKSLLTLVRSEEQLYQLEQAQTYPWVSKNSPPKLRFSNEKGNKLNTFLHNLLQVSLLPTLLHTEDINSMAFSIESRVPFLDHRLVQLCFSMPNAHKTLNGETKRVLRAAMRGIVPNEVLDRKDKTGFITPGHITWLRGALSHTTEGSWKEVEPFIERDKLQSVLSEYRNGNNKNALFVWRLAMLRAFLQRA